MSELLHVMKADIAFGDAAFSRVMAEGRNDLRHLSLVQKELPRASREEGEN